MTVFLVQPSLVTCPSLSPNTCLSYRSKNSVLSTCTSNSLVWFVARYSFSAVSKSPLSTRSRSKWIAWFEEERGNEHMRSVQNSLHLGAVIGTGHRAWVFLIGFQCLVNFTSIPYVSKQKYSHGHGEATDSKAYNFSQVQGPHICSC